MEVPNILAAMIGVSVIYYALLFYVTLIRKLVGGLTRLSQRLKPVRR